MKFGASVLVCLLLVALGADLLASDLPLLARADGRVWWLPCMTRPPGFDAARVDWAVHTPIPYGPNQTLAATRESRDEPPPWAPDGRHWLGTDELGRDVAARLVHGARVSLFIALFTVLVSLAVGMAVGGLAGALGGATDLLLSRLIEVVTTFPLMFFLLALLALIRTQSLWPVILALGLTRWTDIARLVRAEVLSLRTRDYVLAARAMGVSLPYIMLRHLLPNGVRPVIVAATFSVAGALLLESGLAFLGVGVAPPTASWGELLSQAQRTLVSPGAWWLAVFPGAAIALTVLAVNALGGALERTFDDGR